VYCFLGGEHAKAELDSMKDWLGVHTAAVTAVLFSFSASTDRDV